MAPDLNSVPPSPRHATSSYSPHATNSRRASQNTMPLASPSLNILPSNQGIVNQASPLPSPNAASMSVVHTGDNSGVGSGPGPLRHPRPLTHAELHLQLEKEQEAVVNRLTRELSMLRAAQNASVVSNTSSTSAGLPDVVDNSSNHLISGPSHPAPSQRQHHRSSSSASARSISNNTGSISMVGGSISAGITPSSTADRNRSSIQSNPQSLSRQNSSSRRSGASSPAPHPSAHSSYASPDSFPQLYHSRPSLSQYREPSSGSVPTHAGEQHRSDSITSIQTTGRYEEAAIHRYEFEVLKRENEALKRKIRDLERALRERRQSDASRTRSESVSTTASVSVSGVGRGREREKDGDEDGVRVGESARSAGLGRP